MYEEESNENENNQRYKKQRKLKGEKRRHGVACRRKKALRLSIEESEISKYQ